MAGYGPEITCENDFYLEDYSQNLNNNLSSNLGDSIQQFPANYDSKA